MSPPGRIPRHVAVIMDGNGRWAARRGLPRVAGHREGARSIRAIVRLAGRLGIEVLTLYAFSVENWKRPGREVSLLMGLLREYLRKELPELLENDVRLCAIGRRHDLPAAVQKELAAAERATAGCTGLKLVLALSYSGRADLVDAARAIARDVRAGRLSPSRVDERILASRLSTRDLPEVDLLVRTSGEMRISNFLLWEGAYAEFVVTKTLWPDFRERHFRAALREFARRERRFGGLGPRKRV